MKVFNRCGCAVARRAVKGRDIPLAMALKSRERWVSQESTEGAGTKAPVAAGSPLSSQYVDPSTTRASLAEAMDLPGTGKTTVEGFTSNGFLVNNLELEGSVLCLPRSALLWAPQKVDEVTLGSLELIRLITPPIEILLIGCGDEPRRPDPEIVESMRRCGIVVEQADSLTCLSTFNILNSEDRRVAAALLHPAWALNASQVP